MWDRLLESLTEWAEVRAVTEDRITLLVPAGVEPERTVELVMTRHEWDELVTIPYADFDAAAAELKRSVLRFDRQLPYLVYENYELVPSPEPTIPEDPATARLSERARQHPEGIGRWYALDRDGNVVDDYRPPDDP